MITLALSSLSSIGLTVLITAIYVATIILLVTKSKTRGGFIFGMTLFFFVFLVALAFIGHNFLPPHL